MENQNNYAEDIINRYIYQVTRHLPVKNRKDIEEEIRALIYDMLEAKAKESQPSKEDIDSVLQELGSPYELADKYRDKSRYLIGPVLFPVYLMILKIVIAATLLGMTVATVLGLITAQNTAWYSFLGSWFFDIIGGLFAAFAWVTVIFAIFEWRGVNLQKLMPQWELSSLPPVPVKEISIPVGGPVINIIFTIFSMIILAFSPQLIGAYYFSSDSAVIPVFDLNVLRTVLPLFLICFGLSILRNIWEIIERRITLRYAVFTVIINLVKITLYVIVFTQFKIWNENFIEESNALFHMDLNTTIQALWNQFTANLVILLVVVYVIDSAVTIYKALRYGKNMWG